MRGRKPTVEEVLRMYGSRIEGQIRNSDRRPSGRKYSREYSTFRKEMAPDLNRYERWCKTLGNFIKLKVSEKDRKRIKKDLDIAHLDVKPWQAMTLSVTSFLSVFFIGILVSVSMFLFTNEFPVLLFIMTVFSSAFLFNFVNKYPERFAGRWRLKASSQMVSAILYIVVYMRHTSNLEKAIAFASEHLQYPLSLDLKKVFYDVEVGKFSTIKESLDNYLEGWREFAPEFIESFHLIESSLFEPDNGRRILTLEKSLQVILDGVYDKMLKFTHNVRSPLTNVYMLGVVLPTLGLALLPLASALVQGILEAVHVFILFNLIVPFFVFYLTDKILLLRPGGHGETSFLERNPLYPEYKNKKHYVDASMILVICLLLGFMPLIFQYTGVPEILGLEKDYAFAELGLGFMGEDNKIFDFVEDEESGKTAGPFGAGALFLSLFIPLGIAMFFSAAYGSKTKKMIIERNKTRELEKEFNNSLFQIGNRLGGGTPPELAFGTVAESSKGLMTEDFFRKVNFNIRRGGMNVERAIFDKRRGAINFYPSEIIATSMRILVESSKKGLKIAAVSLMNISEYIKNVKKITNRLKDLLAEISSDMKSNMTFLAPLLSGVVVGLALMITSILGKIDPAGIVDSETSGILSNLGGIESLFNQANVIPPYFLQISIGIYIIQIIFILTSTLVTVDSGEDKLEKVNKTGKNLRAGIMLYFMSAFLATIVLSMLVSLVLSGQN